jgi:hypothetical protein
MPGQTVIFLGDHTSPDSPGYVQVVGDVLARFQPGLRLNLVSAGAPGHTAGGLASPELLQILTTSRPDWLSVAIGLADAAREPMLPTLFAEYNERQLARDRDSEEDGVIGPEHRTGRQRPAASTNGKNDLPHTTPVWERLTSFTGTLSASLETLHQAGVRLVLHTPVAVGSDPSYPLNLALRAYGKVIREAAASSGSVLVDVQQAFAAILDRATTYKQRVALADLSGQVNPQGQALLARTFLNAFGLLPPPGFRPLRGEKEGAS